MATLELMYEDYMTAVGRLIGYLAEGQDYGDLSVGEKSICDGIVQSGYRRFITPPMPHVWSFLSPQTTLAVTAAAYIYQLPADFGSIEGPFTLQSTTSAWSKIPLVAEAQVRDRHVGNSITGKPLMAAIRPKAFVGTATGRYEVFFWPAPDASYTLQYRYNVQVLRLSQTALYALGGAVHSETILECCLWVADERESDNPQSGHKQSAMERLQASIRADLEHAPRSLSVHPLTMEEGWRLARQIVD